MGLENHGMFQGLDISGSGMGAERARLRVIATNIANAEVTKTEDGLPYRRKVISFAPLLNDMIRQADPTAKAAMGVKVDKVVEDQSPFVEVYRPGHPDADENGIVKMPNVNMTFEMVDMMTALRAYEANLTASKAFKQMAERTIRLGR